MDFQNARTYRNERQRAIMKGVMQLPCGAWKNGSNRLKTAFLKGTHKYDYLIMPKRYRHALCIASICYMMPSDNTSVSLNYDILIVILYYHMTITIA